MQIACTAGVITDPYWHCPPHLVVCVLLAVEETGRPLGLHILLCCLLLAGLLLGNVLTLLLSQLRNLNSTRPPMIGNTAIRFQPLSAHDLANLTLSTQQPFCTTIAAGKMC